ncbi:hypothetical protein Leryth_009384 [Lithospermum erythrorhizon]|nr:hypothetical protein Leryth_009384 [Lithospermum erythrorhizon]
MQLANGHIQIMPGKLEAGWLAQHKIPVITTAAGALATADAIKSLAAIDGKLSYTIQYGGEE